MGGEAKTVWNQAAANAASTTFGTALGMIFAKSQDRRQLDQQERLQKLQIRGEKELMDMRALKDFEMWQKTSYGGQMAEMKKAGINPALMYGMGGGGGQTIGQGSPGVTGGQAAGHTGEVQAAIGMGLQMRMMEAQVKVMESQANKNNVEAAKTGGVDTEETKSNIALLNQGLNNKKAEEEMTKVQTQIGKIDLWVKDKSKEDAAEIIMWQAEKVLNEMDSIHRQNIVDQGTMVDRIAMVKEELAIKVLQQGNIKADTGLKRAQTTTEKGKPAVMGAQINLMGAEVQNLIRSGIQKWKELEIMDYNSRNQQINNETNAWVREMEQQSDLPLEIIKGIAQAIIFRNIISPDKPGPTPIQGFRK